ncbi:MAG: PAS domain S-box protein [Bacteroidetes bacterium]|nr:PAS domain S-box protein [Bacteroidota bacterium]MBU1114662.1 PAS domain S-box protein [Bacteroidota bacterium]MBU1798976.1 PAS domain S-box protein [Bacteroidota bacterium]
MTKFFKWIVGKSIKRQLILGVAFVHLLLMTIFVYDLTQRQKNFLLEKANSDALFQSNVLALSSEVYLRTDDLIGLQEVLETFSKNHSISYAMIINKNGLVLSHTDKSKIGLYLNDSVSIALLSGPHKTTNLISSEENIETAVPIIVHNTFLGWARIAENLAENRIHIEYVNRTGVFYTLVAIFIGTLFAIVLSRVVLKQLKLLLTGAEQFGLKQENIPIPIITDNEVGVVSEVFNKTMQLVDDQNSIVKMSEIKYRTLIQKIQSAVVVHGSDTQILTCNAAAEKLLGLTEDQLLGKKAIDPDWHFSREDGTIMPLEEYPVNRILTTRQPLRNLVVRVHRSNNENDVWVLVNGDPVFSDDNKLTQVIITFTDITEHIKAEQNIAIMNFALNHVRETVFLIDEHARFHYVNEDACRILEYSRDELLELSVYDIDPDYPISRWSSHWEELKTKCSFTFEGRHKAKDGRIFPVEVNANYFVYNNKGYNLALARDITDRKRAEAELKEQLDEINNFNKLMIGREDKMIELKKEINILLEKEGKPNKYDIPI